VAAGIRPHTGRIVNELKLLPLTCPQCGAAGVVRAGTRITRCERCGANLILTETFAPKYEAVANLNAAQAATTARAWLDERGQAGMFSRPELLLIPYHEISGRRVGVFERKLPVRRQIHRTVYSPQSGGKEVETKIVYDEKEDTKVMVSDVQHLTPAAPAPWGLTMFDAPAVRRVAELRSFDLVEAQRRATVYAEEQSPSALADQRFTDKGSAEMVATSRRTLFFPFWSIPVQTEAGSYEIVVEGVSGNVIAWRLPEVYRSSSLNWALLAVPGALGLGQALRALLFDTSVIDPVIAFAFGAIAAAAALYRSNRPDWYIQSWPRPDTIARLERRGS
jgi:ribosomal protein L37AE/L43A